MKKFLSMIFISSTMLLFFQSCQKEIEPAAPAARNARDSNILVEAIFLDTPAVPPYDTTMIIRAGHDNQGRCTSMNIYTFSPLTNRMEIERKFTFKYHGNDTLPYFREWKDNSGDIHSIFRTYTPTGEIARDSGNLWDGLYNVLYVDEIMYSYRNDSLFMDYKDVLTGIVQSEDPISYRLTNGDATYQRQWDNTYEWVFNYTYDNHPNPFHLLKDYQSLSWGSFVEICVEPHNLLHASFTDNFHHEETHYTYTYNQAGMPIEARATLDNVMIDNVDRILYRYTALP